MSAPSIPGYQIIRKLGEGGVASIWQAHNPEGALCAIKILHVHLIDEPALHGVLRREGALLQQLSHPRIRRCHRWGRAPSGASFLELAYLRGVPLSALLQRVRGALRQHIPLGVVCGTLAEACEGLHAAHDAVAGLIHRDVSPQNILLTHDGRACLIDFGIAKAPELPLSAALQSAMALGKAPYMSPEQCRGEALDRRSDVFAAGIVLWECLAGRRLFRADDDAASMALILAGESEDYPRPSMHREGIPKGLEDACMKALAYHRDDRFASCEAFREALVACRMALGVQMDRAMYLESIFGPEILAK